MALSSKEAAILAIEQLPDDASTEEIAYTLYVRAKIEAGLRDIEAGRVVSHAEVKKQMHEYLDPVPRRLVREGHVTVLQPTRPVPQLDAEAVNELIDTMRREREDRFPENPDWERE